MKFETLKKDNKKKIAIGVIAVISITLVGVLASSFAKYKLTESISLVRGTINYKAYDFKIMAMYQQKENQTCTEDNCYVEISTMPSASNYKINEAKSYCTLDNKNKDNKAKIYTNDRGEHVIATLSKQDKCYLYFDEYKISARDTILSGINPSGGATSFKANATADEGILTGVDDDGTTYYYRGTVTNNYLKFGKYESDIYFGYSSSTSTNYREYNTLNECQNASSYNINCKLGIPKGTNMWWRIIRINGDGTIRIIYNGTSYHANGTSTTDSQIGISAFNPNRDDNAYVGFMYGQAGQSTYASTHSNINKSTILSALDTWYINNLATHASKIDINAGFCGDRSMNTGNALSGDTKRGYGRNKTAYGAYGRVMSAGTWASIQRPVFNCANSDDLYTVNGANKGNKALENPIGLITADEVIYAGGFAGTVSNKEYYLYNGQNYWTMSPHYYYDDTRVFYINASYNLNATQANNENGVRPVINLRADVPITGSGTQNDPFIVN